MASANSLRRYVIMVKVVTQYDPILLAGSKRQKGRDTSIMIHVDALAYVFLLRIRPSRIYKQLIMKLIDFRFRCEIPDTP